jgi:hypothetical protein
MQTGLKEIAQALNAGRGVSLENERPDPVAICVPSWLIDEHLEWWRPAWWLWHYLSPQNESGVRWYDCAEAVVVPVGDAPRFAFPDVTSLDQLNGLLAGRWMRDAPSVARSGGSLIVRTNPMPAWSAQVSHLANGLSPDGDPQSVAWPLEANREQPATFPVDFGHALQLTAYDMQGHATPGSVITVTTYWRVTASLEPRLALFTHIFTGTNIVAQRDHLAITLQNLQPGDVFLQTHVLEIPDTVERGWYQVAVGVYSQDTGTRLPVYDGEIRMADQVLFRPLRVRRN